MAERRIMGREEGSDIAREEETKVFCVGGEVSLARQTSTNRHNQRSTSLAQLFLCNS